MVKPNLKNAKVAKAKRKIPLASTKEAASPDADELELEEILFGQANKETIEIKDSAEDLGFYIDKGDELKGSL